MLGCRYMVISNNERQMCLLIDFRYFLMTLLIKKGGYAFLIKLDLMFSMPL